MYSAAQNRLAAAKSRLLNSVSKASSTSALFFSSVVVGMIFSTLSANGCKLLTWVSLRFASAARVEPQASCLSGAIILHRPVALDAQGARRASGPVRVAQHLASKRDEIGLSRTDDVIGLFGRRDHSDSPGGDSGAPADLRRERRLV